MPKTNARPETASDIDWSQYGLQSDSANNQQTNADQRTDHHYLMQGGLPHQNELFRDQVSTNKKNLHIIWLQTFSK